MCFYSAVLYLDFLRTAPKLASLMSLLLIPSCFSDLSSGVIFILSELLSSSRSSVCWWETHFLLVWMSALWYRMGMNVLARRAMVRLQVAAPWPFLWGSTTLGRLWSHSAPPWQAGSQPYCNTYFPFPDSRQWILPSQVSLVKIPPGPTPSRLNVPNTHYLPFLTSGPSPSLGTCSREH